ncbi:MAG TPA: ABC transporter substrate-binding protein, partial [Acidimicrobiia bacterium]|nr:ABC transporter substrate-binding protein [Acidimicrobiia bacterium]
MRLERSWLVALFVVLAIVVSACAAEEEGGTEGTEGAAATETTQADLSGTSVTLFGPESSDEEAGAFQDALDVFAEESGINVTYTGARDFSDQINAQAAGGNPPDIAIFPQPGKVADFARQGFILALPDSVVAAIDENWTEDWKNFGVVDGTLYAVPNKSDLKSIVWYNVAGFNEGGYEIPETWDELTALSDQMIADGNTPWCVGIESGPATGWPFTDWVEEMMMREYGADVYDQWVHHDIPFDDSQVVDVFNIVRDEWTKEGATYAAGGSIAATPFGDNGQPLADGTCLMHRQASFFAAFMPEGTEFGPDGQVNTFYFPPVDPDNRPTLVAGTQASAFRDA